MKAVDQLYDFLCCDEIEKVPFEYFCDGGKKRVTSPEYKKTVELIRHNLKKTLSDIALDSYIGIQLENSIYYYACVIAVLMCGYSVVLLDKKLNTKECEELLKEAGGSCLITDKNKKESNNITCIQLKSILNEEEIKDSYEFKSYGKHIAFSTSGSLGKSKVIQYSVGAILKQIERTYKFYDSSEFLNELRKKDKEHINRFVSVLPMNHIFGFICPIVLMNCGYTLFFPERMSVSLLLQNIKKYKIWGCFGVPMLWEAIFNIITSRLGKLSRETLDLMLGEQFVYGLSGGTSMDNEIRKAYYNAEFYISTGFGMTEVGCVTMMEPTRDDITSEGQVYDWYDYKIKDFVNDAGELWVKSDVMFDGYLKNGEFVAMDTDSDGFFNTGDIFKVNGKTLFFIGRQKNIIVNSSGENIYIDELENAFYSLKKRYIPFGIIPFKNEPLLLISAGKSKINEALKEELSNEIRNLDVYKRPFKAMFIEKELPMSTKGQLKRYEISLKDIEEYVVDEIIYKKIK